MRTKTLLIAAASALAAGVTVTQAQVYSQNIVGYVNAVYSPGFSAAANPFNEAAGNAVTNIIQNPNVGGSGQWDGTYVYTWTGHTYNIVTLDSTIAGGVADPTDSYPTNAPIINPGTGFFVANEGTIGTNTYVGTVALSSYPGTTTNVIPASPAFSLVASVLPIGGGVSSVLGLTNVVTAGSGALDGDYIYQPNIVSGHFLPYIVTTIDSTVAGGFADPTDSYATNEPVIPVAGNFFFVNENATPVTWIQSLNQ